MENKERIEKEIRVIEVAIFIYRTFWPEIMMCHLLHNISIVMFGYEQSKLLSFKEFYESMPEGCVFHLPWYSIEPFDFTKRISYLINILSILNLEKDKFNK